jgi:cytochrome P450
MPGPAPQLTGPAVQPPLPRVLPPDTLQLTEWAECHEALRSTKLVEYQLAFPELMGGIFPFADGDPHRSRRRVMNALVRPEAIERYQRDVLPAVLDGAMHDRIAQDSSGVWRADLVDLLHHVFVGFAVAVAGLTDADSSAHRNTLLGLFAPIRRGTAAHLATEGKDGIMSRALHAKREFRERFFGHSLQAHRAEAAVDEQSGVVRDPASLSALGLMVRHEHWAGDEELMLRETLGIFTASISTSTQATTNAVHRLSNWFAAHPEDRRLREDEGFLRGALLESLRMGPQSPCLIRIATEDFQLSNGKAIAKGQHVAIFHAMGASRDRAIFGTDADAYDPRRHLRVENVPAYGLAFGSGPHMCIGQRMVLGVGDAGGAQLLIVKTLLRAGVAADPDREPTTVGISDLQDWASYPVVFSSGPAEAR